VKLKEVAGVRRKEVVEEEERYFGGEVVHYTWSNPRRRPLSQEEKWERVRASTPSWSPTCRRPRISRSPLFAAFASRVVGPKIPKPERGGRRVWVYRGGETPMRWCSARGGG
jgi:hypothetical protein